MSTRIGGGSRLNGPGPSSPWPGNKELPMPDSDALSLLPTRWRTSQFEPQTSSPGPRVLWGKASPEPETRVVFAEADPELETRPAWGGVSAASWTTDRPERGESGMRQRFPEISIHPPVSHRPLTPDLAANEDEGSPVDWWTIPLNVDCKWIQFRGADPELASELSQAAKIIQEIDAEIPGHDPDKLTNPLSTINVCAPHIIKFWAGLTVEWEGAVCVRETKRKTTSHLELRRYPIDAAMARLSACYSGGPRDRSSTRRKANGIIKKCLKNLANLRHRGLEFQTRINTASHTLGLEIPTSPSLRRRRNSNRNTIRVPLTPPPEDTVLYEEQDSHPPLLSVDSRSEPITDYSSVEGRFPAHFYPQMHDNYTVVTSTHSKLKTFLYDRDTLFLLVFAFVVASGILAGMAFFNPETPGYAAGSQLCRVYASLWCLLIPLFRDSTLPVWPARGWLYATAAVSAALTALAVGLCGVDARWSGLAACIGDFAMLAATVLLAMVVVHSAKDRAV
ncbi:hypothetical protein Dda_0148 [Drechslerella dactyloides]|uniref:Uncharacterized protein n=1 Tax=Drechslerella dactyloides TaxID=74499 RepID=A0AAD6NMF8_DREDA|nr:hypothetical protein Dda_0148 [Drechslerella dactyloides]